MRVAIVGAGRIGGRLPEAEQVVEALRAGRPIPSPAQEDGDAER